MKPDHHGQWVLDLEGPEDVDRKAVLARGFEPWCIGYRRLQARRAVVAGQEYFRPGRSRLWRTPSQIADRRRRIGNAFEGGDASLNRTVDLAFRGGHEQMLLRLRPRGINAMLEHGSGNRGQDQNRDRNRAHVRSRVPPIDRPRAVSTSSGEARADRPAILSKFDRPE